MGTGREPQKGTTKKGRKKSKMSAVFKRNSAVDEQGRKTEVEYGPPARKEIQEQAIQVNRHRGYFKEAAKK